MHKTPWISDRLAPKQKQKQKQKQKSTANNTDNIQKSKAVRQLETLISKLSSQTTFVRDPKGGCFCLAREHALSPYTPSCPTCAFILCHLNAPYHLCPSCSSSLLIPPNPTSPSLINDLNLKLTLTLQNEELERQKVIEEAKRTAGAFPQLSAANNMNPKTIARPQPQLRPAHETSTHKILSLTNKSSSSPSSIVSSGKQKIKIISISHPSTPTPTSSRPSSGTSTPLSTFDGDGDDDDEIIRVPPPPSTIDYARGNRDPNRPWKNFLLGGEDIKYIPLPEEKGKGKKRKDEDTDSGPSKS